MITAIAQYGREGHLSGFIIVGHAGMDDEELGYDIVCAAVSSVALTAAFGLRDVLHKEGSYESESGYLSVDIGDGGDRETDAVIRTMFRGIDEIKKQYPERVKIKGFRR